MPDTHTNTGGATAACPKCGHRPVGDECPACGVIVARYLAKLAAAQAPSAPVPAPPKDSAPPRNLDPVLSALKAAGEAKTQAEAAVDEAMPDDFTLWWRGTAVAVGAVFAVAAVGMFLAALSPRYTLAATSATAAKVVFGAVFPGIPFSFATYYAWSVRYTLAWWIVSISSGGGIALATLFGSIFLSALKVGRPIVRGLGWHLRWRMLLKVAAASGALPLLVAGATALRGSGERAAMYKYLATPGPTAAQQKSGEDAAIMDGIAKLEMVSVMQSGRASDDVKVLVDRLGPVLSRGTLWAVRRALADRRVFVRLDGEFYEIALRDAPEPGRWTISRFHLDGTGGTGIVDSAGSGPPW